MNTQQRPSVPKALLNKWQHIVDLLAQLSHTRAVLITRVRQDDISLLLGNRSEDNPFQKKGYNKRCSDMYCDHVIRSQKPLLVEDATQSSAWQNAPQIECDMTFYLGFPLRWPDGEPFGTICLMDQKQENNALQYRPLIEEFQALINNDLMLLQDLESHHQQQIHLEKTLEQKSQEIAAQSTDLDEINTALRVLLRQREYDRKEMQSEASEELRRIVLPHLDELEQSPLNTVQQNCLERLRHQLTVKTDNQAISTTLLSPTEQKIARYIQQDKSSKEIADQMHLAKCTVDFHRQNIRKKLGIKSASVNLKSYLMSLV